MMNVDSAERLLPDTAKDGLRSAVADTREAAQHAIEVIGRLGMLLKPGSDGRFVLNGLLEAMLLNGGEPVWWHVRACRLSTEGRKHLRF
jgi:hypothetical protein